MRVFSCLSRNISMAQEKEERTKRRRHLLNFKQKKKRSGPYDYERRPLPPPSGQRKSALGASLISDENIPPSRHANEGGPQSSRNTTAGDRVTLGNRCASENIPEATGQSDACDMRRPDGQEADALSDLTSGFSSDNVTTLLRPFKRRHCEPLPPIPVEDSASIYIKEIDRTEDAFDSDYLPLSQVFPPLPEGESESEAHTLSSEDLSVGHYELLEWDRVAPPHVDSCSDDTQAFPSSHSITSAKTLTETISRTGISDISAITCDSSESQTVNSGKTSRSCGTSTNASTESSTVISAVNKAFIESTGSLPQRVLSGASMAPLPDSDCVESITENMRSLSPSQDAQTECDRPVIRFAPNDLNGPAQAELYNPYNTAQIKLFKSNVIKTPDPYDTLEEDDNEDVADYDTIEVDVETVSQSSSASEFLGCMSFGVQHLLKKDLDGWYYLLTEEIGRKKHLQAHTKPDPVLKTRSYQNIPQINKAVDGQERIVITIPRGKNGFGFSFVDELPPRVGRVDRASPAEQAGVKKGDLVIRINGQNVSRSTCEGVAHLVKKMNPQSLTLELQRDHIVSTTTELTATGIQQPHHPHPYNKRGVGTSTDHLYESIMEKSGADHHKENRAVNRSYEDEYLTDDDTAYSQHGLPTHAGITSTPRPFIAAGHKMSNAQSAHAMSKQESIHRLMSMELDYIDFMHYGIERYSRPLRHCIVSAHQHMTIFQNVEKLVTISEYHIKQMQDNNSSVNSDTDDSQSSESSIFPNSISLIYQSKIHMLCQAYETYANGLVRSNALLRELRKNRDFMNFIKEPGAEEGQSLGHPSISEFINRPVVHIQELHTVLSEIFSATPLHSPDFASLQQIVIKLAHCVTAITGLDSAGRVQSLDSLTSSQGRTSSQTTSSGKGSMASLSSTCSSSEADLRRPLVGGSAASVKSLDRDVMRIQERLVFSPGVQAFQLCQDDRHLIYQGDIYRCRKRSWFKSQLLLFSDLMLMVEEEADGSLHISSDPISIQDLAGIEVNRKYASEFILHLFPIPSAAANRRQPFSASSSGSGNTRAMTLRAPSSQEKFVWRSLLEQRVAAISGSRLQHYGSMKDISNVKTSIIL